MTYFIELILLQLGETNKHFMTLNLFAFGTYAEFTKSRASYIQLKPAVEKKLKMLTIADMAS